jgi:hypothetical protein
LPWAFPFMLMLACSRAFLLACTFESAFALLAFAPLAFAAAAAGLGRELAAVLAVSAVPSFELTFKLSAPAQAASSTKTLIE